MWAGNVHLEIALMERAAEGWPGWCCLQSNTPAFHSEVDLVCRFLPFSSCYKTKAGRRWWTAKKITASRLKWAQRGNEIIITIHKKDERSCGKGRLHFKLLHMLFCGCWMKPPDRLLIRSELKYIQVVVSFLKPKTKQQNNAEVRKN